MGISTCWESFRTPFPPSNKLSRKSPLHDVVLHDFQHYSNFDFAEDKQEEKKPWWMPKDKVQEQDISNGENDGFMISTFRSLSLFITRISRYFGSLTIYTR